jgi:CHASE2 domain-containing sensor protein
VPIRVVDIDDASLRSIGQWPWPRTIVAQLIDKLREAGSAVIAFDIDFAEPDRTSPKLLLPLLVKTPLTRKKRKSFSRWCPIPINGWQKPCARFRL